MKASKYFHSLGIFQEGTQLHPRASQRLESVLSALAKLDAQISRTQNILFAVNADYVKAASQRAGDESLLEIMVPSTATNGDPLSLLLSPRFTKDPVEMAKLLNDNPQHVIKWACARNARILRSLKKVLQEGSTLKEESEHRNRTNTSTYQKWFAEVLVRLRERVIDSPETCEAALKQKTSKNMAYKRQSNSKKKHNQLWVQHVKGTHRTIDGKATGSNLVSSMRQMGLHKFQNH